MSTNRININGQIFSGGNITIVNGRVTVDGVDQTPDAKVITITVEGDLRQLTADACSSIEVRGNAGPIKTMSGDVAVGGQVSGPVSTMSGSVEARSIEGGVSTMSGNIRGAKL